MSRDRSLAEAIRAAQQAGARYRRRRHSLAVRAAVVFGAEPHPVLVALPLAVFVSILDALGVVIVAEADPSMDVGVRLRTRTQGELARHPSVAAAVLARADELAALEAWRMARPLFGGEPITD